MNPTKRQAEAVKQMDRVPEDKDAFCAELRAKLSAAGQEHLWQHWRSLSDAEANHFQSQLLTIDWGLVHQLLMDQAVRADDQVSAVEMARRAAPPEPLVHRPVTPSQCQEWRDARAAGEDWLCGGKVGVIVVAGGQGTRLGSPLPKGMFPAGPVSGISLFQWFCEQLQHRRRLARQAIPYAVMTSSATHAMTLQYLKENQYFGLPANDVCLFQQGNMPAVDIETGRALLSERGELALSPDGHGGVLAALSRCHILEDWADRGIETLYYHQIDNPSTMVCDPAFIGWHLRHQAQASVKVVAKRSADEKMGVVISVEGRTRVIEYSDLPEDVAAQTDSQGRLQLWAGNMAVHLFQRRFLEQALLSDEALPFHVARKIVPYWTPTDGKVIPVASNAFKLERFIFDILPWAEKTLVVEADRAAEFHPIKNRDGADSPATSRAALTAQHRDWLRQAGVDVAEDVPVEISPLVALEADDLAGRLPSGLKISEPLHLTEAVLESLRSST